MIDPIKFSWRGFSAIPASHEEFQKNIETLDEFVNDIARDTVSLYDYSIESREDMLLGTVVLEDLGQTEGLYYEEALSLLQECGFRLVPSYLPPHVFLQTQSTQKRERLHFATEAIKSKDGIEGNFYLGHDSLKGVFCFYKHPQGKEKEKRGKWEPASKFVVVIPT